MSRFLAGALAVSIMLAGCGAPATTAQFAAPADVDAALVPNSSAALGTAAKEAVAAADLTGPYAAIAPGEAIPGNEDLTDSDIAPTQAAADTAPVLPDLTGPYTAIEPGAAVPSTEEMAEIEEDAASALALDDIVDFSVQSLFMYKATIFKIRDKMSAKANRKGNFAKACEKALDSAGKKTSQEMKDLLAEGAKGKEAFLVKAWALSHGGPFTLAFDRKWRLFGLKSEISTSEEHDAFYDVCVKLAAKYAN